MPKKIVSFGYKHRLPVSLNFDDMVIDVRRIIATNPYNIPRLKNKRGDDSEVIKFLEGGRTDAAYEIIKAQVVRCKGTLYVGCTGGHHRSVYIANRLGKDLGVEVEHRDYNKQ